MDKQKLVEELFSCAQDDWLALWMIAGDVEAELDSDDPEETREATIDVVRELLKHGLRAGDSPVNGDCVHFSAWANQDPDAIAAYIRREWQQRGEPPGWDDAPWFAAPAFVLRGCN